MSRRGIEIISADPSDWPSATCSLCGWSKTDPSFDVAYQAMRSHDCAAKPTRTTPVARQLIIDSHGATFTTPRYRWDYRRPHAWLPLSMRDPGPPPFEPDYSRAYMWPVVPERKTWRGWWGTLQRTDMTEAVTATRETP